MPSVEANYFPRIKSYTGARMLSKSWHQHNPKAISTLSAHILFTRGRGEPSFTYIQTGSSGFSFQ